ncbi:MAG: sodium:proton antiporter [Coriobacteriales bacterium]|jgi:CPA1 family monovalent cation:H+ antiporter|nr:sodium:proton antiporter [Coriobacteriales bacterium]
MLSFEYILILLGGVLVSNLISQQFPKVSTPLIQIGLGIALAILPIHFEIGLDPELFLVLFIAPLLFEDAKRADKPALWRQKRPILLLALSLVFATTLIVGFLLNWFAPSIPLAAAFALAAALAPTDAVAVSSLKETATIGEKHRLLLQGESLLNDASGVVSFQFAIAAMVTGSFSLLEAGGVFLLMFFGGLAVGVVLMLLRFILVRALHAAGVESVTFHVLFEMLTPFLVFLVAEVLGVSGIIAVVAAGIAHSFSPRQSSPANARHTIVSTSVWAVISFTLNGVVFLILGTQLPHVTLKVWDATNVDHNFLILLVLVILVALLLLRFFWVLIMHRNDELTADEPQEPSAENTVAAQLATSPEDVEIEREAHEGFTLNQVQQSSYEHAGTHEPNHEAREAHDTQQDRTLAFEFATKAERVEARAAQREQRRIAHGAARREERARRQRARKHPQYLKSHLKDALLLSLTGAKGAISLAVILTVPLSLNGEPFPERDLLLFLVSGVIVLSLLIANFLVPLVAPKKVEPPAPQGEINATIDIFRSVIHALLEHMTPADKVASEEVVRRYINRINQLKRSNQIVDPTEDKIRADIVNWERSHTLELVDEGKVAPLAGTFYLYQLSRLLARVEHHNEFGWVFSGIGEQLVHRVRQRKRLKQLAKATTRSQRKNFRKEVQWLQKENYRFILRKLDTLMAEPDAPIRAINTVVADFKRRLARLEDPRLFRPGGAYNNSRLLEVEQQAMQYERDAIEQALLRGKITRATAKQLRDSVAIMELDIEDQLGEE